MKLLNINFRGFTLKNSIIIISSCIVGSLLLGLLLSKIPTQQLAFLDSSSNILNMADMQIDKYGNDVGYDKRLEDIKNRYGENSTTYKNAEILISQLRSEK